MSTEEEKGYQRRISTSPTRHQDAQNMEERLLQIFNCKEFSDVIIEVGEDHRRIFASKSMLASYSPFFFKLFQWPRRVDVEQPKDEDGRYIVEFETSTYETMLTLIGFMYGGSLLQEGSTISYKENINGKDESKDSQEVTYDLDLSSVLPLADHLLMDMSHIFKKLYSEVGKKQTSALVEIISKAEEYNHGESIATGIFDPDLLWDIMKEHAGILPGDFIGRIVTQDDNALLKKKPLETFQIFQKWTEAQSDDDVKRFHSEVIQCTQFMGPIEFGALVEPTAMLSDRNVLEFYKEVALAGGRSEFIDSGTNWIRVGNQVDAEDHTGAWYPSDIIEKSADGRLVLIRFHGWDERFNEWIEVDSNKLARLGTHTRRHDNGYESSDDEDSDDESDEDVEHDSDDEDENESDEDNDEDEDENEVIAVGEGDDD